METLIRQGIYYLHKPFYSQENSIQTFRTLTAPQKIYCCKKLSQTVSIVIAIPGAVVTPVTCYADSCVKIENIKFIRRTHIYNFDRLKPHFYIVKLGFTGVYIIFLILLKNIDCGYSLEMSL